VGLVENLGRVSLMNVLVPLGEFAYLVRFGSAEMARRWAVAAKSAGDWVVDVVPAYDTVAVFLDPEDARLEQRADELSQLKPTRDEVDPPRIHQIPVLYDGLDLDDVARVLALTRAEVVSAHVSQDYRIDAIGFQPGFPYAGNLPESLRGLPRRASPRTRVPAGSVAIVGNQTAIYPSESPGGWHLLGRTPLRIVDMPNGHFPIRVGDRLRFTPIERDEFEIRRGVLP
jgi:KipI family sensor histidine kinase inhibitor